MSWPRPFRGVRREEHSGGEFLFVWRWERKSVSLLQIIHADVTVRDNKALCCLSHLSRLPALFTWALLVLTAAAPPACWDLLWHHMMKQHHPATPHPSAAGAPRHCEHQRNRLYRQMPHTCYLMWSCTDSCSHWSVSVKCHEAKKRGKTWWLVSNTRKSNLVMLKLNPGLWQPYCTFCHFCLKTDANC